MLGLDQYGPFLLSAFGITVVMLGGYGLYLWSRLNGARRRSASTGDYSGLNVNAAAPMATTAQPASSAKGPSTV
jgi:hypothetical protein